jgi:hypothetical protein
MATRTTPRHENKTRRRRLFPLVWLGAAGAALALGLGISGTLAGFTASITNNANTASTGTLTLTETGVSGVGGTSTCGSGDATCPLNKFGGQPAMAPDILLAGTVPTGTIPADTDPDQNVGIVRMTNTGTSRAATLTLAGNPCTSLPSSGGQPNLCNAIDIAVYASAVAPTSGTSSTYGTQVFYGSATTLATTNLVVASGIVPTASEWMTFVIWVDGSANNTYQALNMSEPLVWTLAS